MANTIYSQGDKVEYGIKTFIVDTEEDKQNLSIKSSKMGSKCYVIDSKKWYILNGSYEWNPFVDAGGSGGSGSPFNIKGSVPTEEDLPNEDNEIGDLYIVMEDSSEWVWVDNNWEKLGPEIIELDNTFILKGIVWTYDNLPYNDNKNGYVYKVDDEDCFYVWMDETTSWEKIEVEIDNSFDLTSSNPVKNSVITQAFNNALASLDNKINKPIVNTISDTSISITPIDNNIYNCGELTSLTISNPPASGTYAIIFFSGATATVVTGIDNFTVEANKRYRINVQDGYATFDSWPYVPV